MSFIFKKHFSKLPQRRIVALMGFFAFSNAYTLRVCLSMTITQMTKPLNSSDISDMDEKIGNSENEVCPEFGVKNYDLEIAEQTLAAEGFEWSEYTQGIILSSFYWGYVITHVPGGLLCTRFGPTCIVGLGVLFTAILNILTPVATKWGDSTALITIRILMGLCGGVIPPGMSCLLAQWIPARERSTLSAWTYTGIYFGILVSNLCSGLIMHSFGSDSWPFVFYIFGGLGVLWYLFWLLLCYDSPRVHPYLGDKERVYLERELGDAVTDAPKPAFPWRHALISPPFIALVIIQSGQDWTNYIIMSDLPKYMNNVLKLPIWLNGYASSMYNITCCIFGLFMSWLSDWLIVKGHVSRTWMRKINAAIASLGPGIMMVAAMYVGCDVTSVVVLITVGLTFAAASVPGIKVNSMDLSPNYAGTLMGISNGVAAVTGIFAPYSVGILAPNQSMSEWRFIFWITAGVYLVTCLNFCIFASGKEQRWNDPVFLRIEEKKQERD